MKKRQFDKKSIVGVFGEGSESTVYAMKDNDKFYALKIFKDKFVTPSKTEDIPYEVFQNKERKLILLSQTSLLTDEEKPIDLFYDGDKFVGYSMFIDRLRDFEYYYSSSKKVKLELLKQLKEKINLLNSNGIYVGDFNIENYGVKNDGSIKIRDIDNFSIGGLPFDRPTNLVKEYIKKCSKMDNVDNYSFNYFSLGFLLSVEPRALEKFLSEHGLPRKFNTEENRKLLEDLENINDDYEPRYFIDSQKKGLFK